jgi:hypothetical protein
MNTEINEIAAETQLVAADPMVSMIERIALDPNSDLAKLERMLELKEKHDANRAKADFATAFARASADFPIIPLNGSGHNKMKYATLKDITRLTRPVLSANGLALTFSIKTDTGIVVTAELMHKSGHSKETSISLPTDTSGSKNAVQAIGSSQTYGQRYTAQAILGLSLGDDTEDDGRGAASKIETVTADQFFELQGLIEETGTDLDKFILAYGGKPGTTLLEEFPATLFDKAKMQLIAKKVKTND